MTQAQPRFLGILGDVSDLAKALGLPNEAITETGLPVEAVSTGSPELTVPVRSLAEVQNLSPDRIDVAALTHICRAVGVETLLVFTTETERPDATVHVRVFAYPVGIPEDPATGSANGALGAYLVHHRVVQLAEQTISIVSEQGSEMGRPSTVYVEVDHNDGVPTTVRVGGHVVKVIEGSVRF
jgi:trans-2,3-dihydro-3-hydroxyanthranilate isomerase